jgi:hypothetical protein
MMIEYDVTLHETFLALFILLRFRLDLVIIYKYDGQSLKSFICSRFEFLFPLRD